MFSFFISYSAAYVSVYLFLIFLSVCICISLSLSLSLYLCLSLCLSICLSVCLSFFLSFFLCFFLVYLSHLPIVAHPSHRVRLRISSNFIPSHRFGKVSFGICTSIAACNGWSIASSNQSLRCGRHALLVMPVTD